MAVNPMQRRARNSFLVGFLVALVLMAIVVLLLIYQIKSLTQLKQQLESERVEVYVASSDLKSGQTVDLDNDFVMETVKTSVDQSQIISSDDFEFKNEKGEVVEKLNDDGSILKKQMNMKIDVPAGTIVTKDMIVEAGEETTSTQRIQEFNMIILPTRLKNNQYIDIRITLPTGQDYIVLSKKKVLGCTASSIWLKIDEEELLTMNNAIVEAYRISGSKLYALPYIEAGIQEATVPTYTVSREVYDLINNDPNITQRARQELSDRYNTDIRNNHFVPALAPYVDSGDSIVEGKVREEVQNLNAGRQQFIESLEGSDEVGYGG